MNVVVFALQFVLNIALPWWIVRLSERIQHESAAARGWNEASFRSAVVVFGPLCLPIHFARLGVGRSGWHWALRTPLGLAVGVLVMFVELMIVGLSVGAVLWLAGSN